MGCDIHLYTERRNQEGQWEATRGTSPSHDLWMGWAKRDEDKGDTKGANNCREMAKHYEDTLTWFYDGRNYSLFAVLNDVRNDYGFTYIFPRKGFPSDASGEVRSEFEQWDIIDAHSANHITLAELLAFNWDHPAMAHGMVDAETARAWREEGKRPESWCAWTNAPGAVTIEWPITYRDHLKRFIDRLPLLQALSDDPNNVRIVFWFDN